MFSMYGFLEFGRAAKMFCNHPALLRHFRSGCYTPSIHRKRWCKSIETKSGTIDGKKVICQYNEQRILACSCQDELSMFKNTNDEVQMAISKYHDEMTIPLSNEFLGIEVYPEIFDDLPPKCTGCGAILQSNNVNKPGFIPESRNPNMSGNVVKNSLSPEIICSRCFNLKHYNKNVVQYVLPEAIQNFLTHISRRKALILYVVDVMDIPGSFADCIMEIIGSTKHVILVCNKIDRLPVDGRPRYQIQWVKDYMYDSCRKHGLENANVRDVVTVSAKTGFGVKNLVKKINTHWRKNSDIYLVGCSNSGKTSLFNLLVDLFSSSRNTENMLQRGTVSPSAQTTLSLLRYPITKYRFQRLEDRLKTGFSEIMSEEKERHLEVDISNDIMSKEMTKYGERKEKMKDPCMAISSYQQQVEILQRRSSPENLSWLYDTPGLFSKHQITQVLNNQELKLLNPELWFVPRTIILQPGQVMFLGGLCRLDYLSITRKSKSNPHTEDVIPKASQSIFFTIFASPNLPIHITNHERAESFYEKHAGEELLKIPSGGEERMKDFPQLKGEIFEVEGKEWGYSAADVVLSNIGWIAVTAGSGSLVSLQAHTPNGAGLFLREPSFLPTSVQQRGRRGVPYLGFVNRNMYEGTRRRSPSLIKYFNEENSGTSQWMKASEKIRKRQRLSLKFKKTQHQQKLGCGYSARSNPGRYLPHLTVNDAQLESAKLKKTEEVTG